MNKINQFIDNNMKMIILVFLFLNPFLDVFTGLQTHYLNISFSFSSVVRLLFMLLCSYYIFKLDDTNNKNINKNFLYLFLIYLLLFSLTILKVKGLGAFFYEVKNTLNTFYFPIVLISMFDMFNQYNIKITLKQIICIYFIYVLFVFIPDLLGIGFISYYHSKLGSVGFFISANAVGNILSFLMPFITYYLINDKKNIILNLILVLILILVLSDMGTKVPILSLLIVILVHLFYYVKEWINNKKYNNLIITGIISLVLIVSSIFMIPKTSFYKNLEIHKKFLGMNHYYEAFTDVKLVDHFIFSQRLTFLNNTNKYYMKSSLLEKFNGIGYIEGYGTDNVSTKTIEIDYFEIFYRQGILGFIIFFSMIFNIAKKSFKELKNKNLINLEYKTSYLLIILLGLFSGHIFVTPAVSIFVIIVIITSFSKFKFEFNEKF